MKRNLTIGAFVVYAVLTMATLIGQSIRISQLEDHISRLGGQVVTLSESISQLSGASIKNSEAIKSLAEDSTLNSKSIGMLSQGFIELVHR